MIALVDELIEGTWHRKAYSTILYTSYLLFAIAFTGILAIDPSYLSTLDMVLKYYVSIFLIARFNPWARKAMNNESRDFDRRIAFSAGFFLLLTTAAAELVQKYVTKIATEAADISGTAIIFPWHSILRLPQSIFSK